MRILQENNDFGKRTIKYTISYKSEDDIELFIEQIRDLVSIINEKANSE